MNSRGRAPRADDMTKKLFIRTFGCQMNEYDSDKMADLLRAAKGFEITDQPENADLILFNTCSVRERAGKGISRSRARETPEAGAARPSHRRGRLCREPGRRGHRGARALC